MKKQKMDAEEAEHPLHHAGRHRQTWQAQGTLQRAKSQAPRKRRPSSVGRDHFSFPGAEPVAEPAPSAQLTPSERKALLKTVSAGYLEEGGLKEGSHGEIVTERGRTVFELGFARAIRKILVSSN